MSLSRRKNRAWLRQRERTREQLAAHKRTLAIAQQTLELVKMVSATRDDFRDQLAAALKDRTDMLQEIVILRGQLQKFTAGVAEPKPGPWVN